MDMMPVSVDPLSQQLSILTMVGWIALIPVALLLIPIGVLVAILLAQLAMILCGVMEFFPMARYEIYPILKHVRQITARAEALSEKATTGVENIERGCHKGKEALGHGVDAMRTFARSNAVSGVASGALGMLSALGRGLWRALRAPAAKK